MLRITLTGDRQLVERLESEGPRIQRMLTGKLDQLTLQLASYIVSEKLSGQVLQRKTGTLAGSVRAIPAVAEGPIITGGVEAGSGPAGLYAGVHEYGGERWYTIMAVQARALAFIASDGAKVFVRPPRMVIHPPAQPRPFMGPSLDENADDIRSQLQMALDQELNNP